MLTTGIRTAVGLKVQGGDVNRIQEVGRQVETVLAGVPGTRSVFADFAASNVPNFAITASPTFTACS